MGRSGGEVANQTGMGSLTVYWRNAKETSSSVGPAEMARKAAKEQRSKFTFAPLRLCVPSFALGQNQSFGGSIFQLLIERPAANPQDLAGFRLVALDLLQDVLDVLLLRFFQCHQVGLPASRLNLFGIA